MSYDARVFNVMIASPSDVADERSIVREVIYDWNAVHSEKKSMVLLPIGWESHSFPQMGRPQETLNRQMLDKCDLLVGIFGTRIGTDTGEYDSGTIEEIERHTALGKPVMIYFSNQLGDPDTFDSDQYTKLKEWKKKNESRWLYENYDSRADFKDKFYRQLQIKVNEHEIFQFPSEEMNSGLDRSELERKTPQLSDIAKIILKKASQSDTGSVLHCGSMGAHTFLIDGRSVTLNYGSVGGDAILIKDKNIIPDQRPRVAAEWLAALQELTMADLLENTGRERTEFQITEFRVTHRGYKIADMIKWAT